ncbi:MAG TPA: hypothetical protein VN181_07670 [Thermoanaerobaculia bacterium]|nr:hypothetical protein [Thermoanaerobaculia bacterium]
MTPPQRRIVIVAAIAVAATRFLAVARSPWDWDEMLFALAMRHYDVAAHHPHPPGFPLFIAAGHLFGSLQVVVVLASMAIFPAMFFLCRALGMTFRTSVLASLLLAFFPNVWLYGGTSFSDVPSMVLAILAAALLLRGRGAIAAAIGIGFRPQNLLMALAPALRGKARHIVIAILIVAVSYGAAIWLTGPDRYFRALREHQQYIAATDSFLSPARPPLWRLADDFFVRPYRQLVLNVAVALLALFGLRRKPWTAIAIFAPFALFAWLFLDHNSVSRFSIGYMPLIAILAAEGLPRRLDVYIAAVMIAFTMVWMWPALTVVRTTVAPPVAAMQSIPRDATVYVHKELMPYADYVLPSTRRIEVGEAGVPTPWTEQREAFFVVEGGSTFSRPHNALWNIARRRYFDVTVLPLRTRIDYVSGWGSWDDAARWMASTRAIARLPDVGGDAHFFISLHVPRAANVRVTLNGVVIERTRAAGPYLDRALRVPSRGTNELVIESDVPLRLERLEWSRITA